MLPKGFKFEAYETVKRQTDLAKTQPKVPVNKRKRTTLVNQDEESKKDLSEESLESSTKRAKRSSAADQDYDIKRISQRPKKPTNFDDYVSKDTKFNKHNSNMHLQR